MSLNLTLEQEFETAALKQALTSADKAEIIEKFCELVRIRRGEKDFFVKALRDERPLLAEEMEKNDKLRSRLQNYTKQVEDLTLVTQDRIREMQVELLKARAVQAAMSEDLSLLKERNSELLSRCDRVWGFLQQAKKEQGLQEVLRLVGEASRSLPSK
ncbi:MAG TPA: hypothetical protein DD990_22605 [Cyanobacteria bacterium UBA11368]|nr:hypothetical protein [Cyanobacteria bacterium UBA11368]